jgi:hypothetical protein
MFSFRELSYLRFETYRYAYQESCTRFCHRTRHGTHTNFYQLTYLAKVISL